MADSSEHVESCTSITKNIISPLPQCLWLPNLVGWWLTMRGSHILSYMTLYQVVFWYNVTNWSRYISTITRCMTIKLGRVVTYREWLLPIRTGAPTHKVTCFFDQMVLEVAWQIWCYISTWIRSIATKYGKVVNYCEGLPPLESHDPLMTWSCEITWQIKNMSTTTMPLTTKLVGGWSYNPSIMWFTNGYQIWQGGNLPWGASANKATYKLSNTWSHKFKIALQIKNIKSALNLSGGDIYC